MNKFFKNPDVNELINTLNSANPDFISSKDDFLNFIREFFKPNPETGNSIHYSCLNSLKENNYYDKILDFELAVYNPNSLETLMKSSKPKIVMGFDAQSSFIALYNPKLGKIGSHYDYGLYSNVRQFVEGCSEEEYLKMLDAEFGSFKDAQLAKKKTAQYFMLLTKFFTDLNALHKEYFTQND